MVRFRHSIAAAILAVVMFATQYVYIFAAGNNISTLKGIGLAPSDFTSETASYLVSRAEFAYMAARLIRNEDKAGTETRFSDVDKDNIYSGYIEFLAEMNIISGYSHNTFAPEDGITLGDAFKVILKAIGYGPLVDENTDTDKSVNLAYSLGFKRGNYTNSEGLLTRGGAAAIISDALTLQLWDLTYSVKEGETSLEARNKKSGTTLLGRLGISVYTGTVEEVNLARHSIQLKVLKNRFDNNPVIVPAGQILNLTASKTLNIYEFSNTAVEAWVDSDGNLMHIAYQRGIEIKYGYVYAVNGDTSDDSAYGTAFISRIIMDDENTEYFTAEDCGFKFNGKTTTGSVALTGRFARIVLQNDTIIHIESWDLKEGGLITEIKSSYIDYIKGESNMRLEELDEYKEKLYFIGKRSASKDEVKTDSVFYYYERENYLVMVISEKVISDRFDGVANDGAGVIIGDILYSTGGEFFYKGEAGNYRSSLRAGGNYGNLLNIIVKAYIAPNGDVLYIDVDPAAQIPKTFFGVVIGVSPRTALNPDSGQIKLWALNEEITKEIYNINKRTNYKDGLSLSEIAAVAGDLDGNGIFQFTVNNAGSVTEVAKLSPYYGYGDEVKASFNDIPGTISSAYVTIDGERLYFTDSPITVIYEYFGEFTVKRVAWSEIHARKTTGVTLAFYGEEKESTPSLVVLTGNVKDIGCHNEFIKRGVIIGKDLTFNENGERMYNITVVTKGEVLKYLMTEESAASLNEYTYIVYYDRLILSEDEIRITEQRDLSSHFRNWGLSTGIVEKIDEKRVYLDNNSSSFIHPTFSVILEVDEYSRQRFYNISTQDINYGDRIYYLKESSGIMLMVVVKES
jgi:hypothetical protein